MRKYFQNLESSLRRLVGGGESAEDYESFEKLANTEDLKGGSGDFEFARLLTDDLTRIMKEDLQRVKKYYEEDPDLKSMDRKWDNTEAQSSYGLTSGTLPTSNVGDLYVNERMP